MFDIASGETIRTLHGHKDSVTFLKVILGGKFLSGAKDGSIKMWDINTGKCIQSFIGHQSKINSIEASFDN